MAGKKTGDNPKERFTFNSTNVGKAKVTKSGSKAIDTLNKMYGAGNKKK